MKKILTGLLVLVLLTFPALVFGQVMGYNYQTFKQQSTTPGSPASTYQRLYFKTDGSLYSVNSSGVEVGIGGGEVGELADPDVAHGMTTIAGTSVFYRVAPISSTIGGADMYGLTDADQAGALRLTAITGAADPTDTYPALHLRGGKKSGTGWQALGNDETVLVLSNFTTDLITVLGNGNIGILQSTFGTSAAKVLGMAVGTAPTTSPASAAQLWVADRGSVADKATFHMRDEAGNSGPVAFAMGIVTSHGATETATADTLYGNTHLVTGAYTVTLPAVSVGMKGRFYATTANAFSVDCNGSDHFVLGGTALTAGNKVTSDASAGAFFEWEVTAANTITIFFSNVTFTDGGA